MQLLVYGLIISKQRNIYFLKIKAPSISIIREPISKPDTGGRGAPSAGGGSPLTVLCSPLAQGQTGCTGPGASAAWGLVGQAHSQAPMWLRPRVGTAGRVTTALLDPDRHPALGRRAYHAARTRTAAAPLSPEQDTSSPQALEIILTWTSGCSLIRNLFLLKLSLRTRDQLKVLILVVL